MSAAKQKRAPPLSRTSGSARRSQGRRSASRQKADVKPPKLSDDDALVAKWVGEIVDHANDKQAAYDFVDELMRDHPPLRMSAILASMEREAIEAAEDRNLEPLGALIENPLFKDYGVLSPKAMAIISAKLRGTFKPRRGPHKQSRWQRDLNPARGAAKEVDQIEHVLRTYYPKEKGHRDRAIGIAAARAAITRQKLETYLKSRHRRST